MAPNRLNTRAYGPGAFAGTSASAPVVAGLLALIRSRYPDQSNREAYETLRAWAWEDLSNAPDDRLGAGRVRLPRPDATGASCSTSHEAAWALLLLLIPMFRRRP